MVSRAGGERGHPATCRMRAPLVGSDLRDALQGGREVALGTREGFETRGGSRALRGDRGVRAGVRVTVGGSLCVPSKSLPSDIPMTDIILSI